MTFTSITSEPTPTPKPCREDKSKYGVIPEKAEKQNREVEKIAMQVLQNERKGSLAAILAARRLADRACRVDREKTPGSRLCGSNNKSPENRAGRRESRWPGKTATNGVAGRSGGNRMERYTVPIRRISLRTPGAWRISQSRQALQLPAAARATNYLAAACFRAASGRRSSTIPPWIHRVPRHRVVRNLIFAYHNFVKARGPRVRRATTVIRCGRPARNRAPKINKFQNRSGSNSSSLTKLASGSNSYHPSSSS